MSLLRRDSPDPVVVATEAKSNATLDQVLLLTQQMHRQLGEFQRVMQAELAKPPAVLERNPT